MENKETIKFFFVPPSSEEIWENIKPNSQSEMLDEMSRTIFPPKQGESIGEMVWREQLKSSGIIKEK